MMLYPYKQEYLIVILLLASIIYKITAIAKSDRKNNKGADTMAIVALFVMLHFFSNIGDKYFIHTLAVTFTYTLISLWKSTRKDTSVSQNYIQLVLSILALVLQHNVYIKNLF